MVVQKIKIKERKIKYNKITYWTWLTTNRKSLVTNRTGSSLPVHVTRGGQRTAFPFYFHPLSPCYRTQNFGLQLLIQRSILLKKTMIWPSIIWLTYTIPKLVTCLWSTTYKIHIMIPLFQFRFHPICPTLFTHRSYTILQRIWMHLDGRRLLQRTFEKLPPQLTQTLILISNHHPGKD